MYVCVLINLLDSILLTLNFNGLMFCNKFLLNDYTLPDNYFFFDTELLKPVTIITHPAVKTLHKNKLASTLLVKDRRLFRINLSGSFVTLKLDFSLRIFIFAK